MTVTNEWLFPAGSLTRDGWDVVVDRGIDGWVHTGLRTGALADGAVLVLPAADEERMVLPLTGDVAIEWERGAARGRIELAGRPSVFAGPADSASFGPGTALTLTGSGRVAVAFAPLTPGTAGSVVEPAVLRARDTAVEIRGAGRATRQVQNFGTPDGLPAAKLLVCEVVTPAGNWSSYPAHKHDADSPGVESELEEIYYFEIEPAEPTAEENGAFAFFASYPSDDRPIQTAAMVHDRDVALVPYGYHGPASAAPGYDLYYLNVMAGPGDERVWRVTDDPAHAWLRGTWDGQDTDPRLPYGPR